VQPGSKTIGQVSKGDILVTHATDKEFVSAMEKAAAIVTEVGGLTSHAAVVGISLDVPVIVGVDGIMDVIEDNSMVTIDAARGIIYRGITRAL
jgi:pyruvate kinase